MSLTEELNELRREVRAAGEQAYREARLLSRPGREKDALQSVLEMRISYSPSRQKIVHFACAAEWRILLSTAVIEECREAASISLALSTLFWASYRRFGRREGLRANVGKTDIVRPGPHSLFSS